MRHHSIPFLFAVAVLFAVLSVRAAPADQDGKLDGKIDSLVKRARVGEE